MKRICLTYMVIWGILLPVRGQYYVSNNGNDEHPGSFSRPFKTIQHAALLMEAGDTCFIRGGHYRETIRPGSSGQADHPMVFTGYKDEVVVVLGTIPVAGWTVKSDRVIQAHVPQKVSQLLVNDERAQPASEPTLDPAQPYETEGWAALEAHADGTVKFKGKTNWPQNYWLGAYVRILTGRRWIAHMGRIFQSTGSEVSCLVRSEPWNDYNPEIYLGGGVGYIYGHIRALDAPGEWHWQNDTLYYHLRDGEDMHSIAAEARVRLRGFDGRSKSHIHLRNLNFICATVDFGRASHCRFENGSVLFPTPMFMYRSGWCRNEGQNKELSIDHWEGKGVHVSGRDNIVRNSYVANSWGDGISVGGKGNSVINCLVENCNWSATDAACISVTGTGHRIERNTLRNAARSILVNRFAESTDLIYNDLGHAGLMCEDLGMTYSYNTNGKGSVIAYNWVHDNHAESTASGIYLDNYDSNYVVHHNVIWNCTYAIQTNKPAHNHKIFHNTVWNCAHAQWAWGREGTMITGQAVINNISDKKWDVGNTFDSNLTVEGPFLMDPETHHFMPVIQSGALDTGILLPGINDQYIGKAPDVGAYEFGAPQWIPGSSVEPVTLDKIGF
jgi:hypothetical protein